MDRDAFWHRVVDKSHDARSSLSAPERDWLAVRHLCGETYVSGVSSYFEHHGHDYETTRELLRRYRFTDLVGILDAVSEVLFQGASLSDPHRNREVVARYESRVEETGHDEVEALAKDLLDHLYRLEKVADEHARAAGLFT